MKHLSLFLFFLICFSTSSLMAQSLGEDDQTRLAEEEGVVGEEAHILRIFPYQWVDLTEPSKEATTFQAEAGSFAAFSLDESADLVNLDMNFKYFGETFRQGYVTINGFLAFGTQAPNNLAGPTSWSVGAVPSPRKPNNVVAPFWADLTFQQSSGYIFYRTFKPELGNEEYDHFICQWEDAGLFEESRTRVTFQAVLFTNGGIMFQYKEFKPSAFIIEYFDFIRSQGFVTFEGDEEPTDVSEFTDFQLIREAFNLSIGYEDEAGLKGASWTLPIAAGMTLGNQLVPDWVGNGSNQSFLNIIDGRDRRNQAVTGEGGGGGCFLKRKAASTDR